MNIAVLFFANTNEPKHDILVRRHIYASRKTYPRYIHCAVLLDIEQYSQFNSVCLFESTLDGGRFTTSTMEIVKLVHMADQIDYATVDNDIAKVNAAMQQYSARLNLRRMGNALKGRDASAVTCTEPANILLGTNALLCDDLHQQLVKRT